MTEFIDTFFVLDFDRCLGDYGANINLSKKIINELFAIDERAFQLAHDEAKAKGASFQVLEYLEKKDPDMDLDVFQSAYIKRAHKTPGSLLEPGAIEFMDFLRASNYHFCIISFGDKGWQNTKIIAAGFGDIAKLIIPNEYKGHHIAQWLDKENGHFVIPKECFSDGVAKKAREVVLIDDKVKAFNGLPVGARGYLLQDIARIRSSQQGKVPSFVKRVTRLDEIIDQELSINSRVN